MNPNEPIRDARKLGTPKMLVLGLQHMFAMFGATILVPILVQQYGLPLDIQTTLFFAGIGTLFFHVCTKFRVPAFLGSSFAFLGGFSTMANLNTGIYADMSPQDKLAYTCGGIVVAGLLYLALALVIRLVGVKKVMRFLPPVVTGPIIVCIGLTLAPSAVSNASTCWPLALIALATIIIFNIWGKGMFKIIPILMGVVVSYIAALIMNACGVTVLNAAGEAIPLIDFTAVREASILGLPPFQMAKFDLTAILVMAPIALATMMEHIGDMSAISATVGQNFIQEPGLHRTLVGDGHPSGGRLCHRALLYSQDGRHHRLYALRHRGRRVLHSLRHDLRHRRAQHRGEQRGPDQVPQPHHRRRHPGVRPGLLQRHHLHRGRHLHHAHRPGHRRLGGHPAQRHPPRQRLRVRRQSRGRPEPRYPSVSCVSL